MDKTLEEIMIEAAAAQAEKDKQAKEQQMQKGVTLTDLGTLFSQFKTKQDEEIKKAVTDGVAAAFDAMRQSPTGRQGTVQKGQADPRSENPIEYILSKADSDVGHEKLDLTDKDVIAEITKRVIRQGMRDDED